MAGTTSRPADRIGSPPRRQPKRDSWLLEQTPRFVAIEVGLMVAVVCVVIGGIPPTRLLSYGIGAAVLVLVLVLVVPIRGRSVLARLRLRLAYARRRPQLVTDADVPADLVPLAEWVPDLSVSLTVTGRGEEVGVINDGSGWTAVLALTSDDEIIAGAGEQLNLSALSGLTIQDDIIFSGVQVVTYTVPAPSTVLLTPDAPAARAYRELAADDVALPPTVRKTWLCVRLDPGQCLEAVARRGVDTMGIYATLRFGLHRVQTVLKRQGISTRVLGPVEIYDVLALTAGSGPDAGEGRSVEQWQHWECDGLVHTGRMIRAFGSDPTRGYSQLLDSVACAPVLFAITAYTLSPHRAASGGIRLVSPNLASADQAVAHVAAGLGRGVRLAPAGGTQVPTVLATVPLGRGAA